MSARSKGSRAGFTLAEALVALVVAALLAAALTRFIATTRLSAYKLREQVVMDLVSDGLVERAAPNRWQAGQWNGRSGDLDWRMTAAPIAFSATARSLRQRMKITDANPAPSEGASGSAATFTKSAGLNKSAPSPLMDGADRAQPRATQASSPKIIWDLYRVTSVVHARSGRNYAGETVRIGPQRADQPEAQ
jgi:prepilin-type N-terminal cleavage/methylation domain-containing protein